MPNQVYQVKKYQQIRPVFSVYLFVSYDYGARNLDEYFCFYSIASQKFKIKEIFLENVNNLNLNCFFMLCC